ncbi:MULTISPECIES: hypothetical protein [unclassified Microcoleus]|uniref:hypothetical protein n=1 Tax=unclassified Microcoleus TaxID=2642155 RepID=UPI002FD4A8AA
MGQHRVPEILRHHDVGLRILAAGCRSFSRTNGSIADRESVYKCAIGRYLGITVVQSTLSTIASISAGLHPDINVTKLSVSILGHKYHNFLAVDPKFQLSVNEQHFILGRSGLKLFTYV